MLTHFTRFVPQQIPSAKPYPTSGNIIRHEKSLRSGGKRAHTGFVVLCAAALLAFLSPKIARAQDCLVSAQVEPAASRSVQLDVTCPGAPFFKLSESPDYQESATTGVVVSVDSIDPFGEYADLSIRYPDGTAGGNATPLCGDRHRARGAHPGSAV